ncbi:hypothetical protein FQN60_003100 [Etheostoma spectabile]|uniref:Uncharacterized protein n=1 Tax=Etheostoma spectabile TaxID=54343 RepID=A0A5J5CLB6_9PERO|nr:hypothetical protein FQN60_003100 [Etheostoma spectabile]
MKTQFQKFPQRGAHAPRHCVWMALDNAQQKWTESITHLELSLRLHRLLKESVRYCMLHCDSSKREEPSLQKAGTSTSTGTYDDSVLSEEVQSSFPRAAAPSSRQRDLGGFQQKISLQTPALCIRRLNDLQGCPMCLHLPPEEPRRPGDEPADGEVQEPVRPEWLPHDPRNSHMRPPSERSETPSIQVNTAAVLTHGGSSGLYLQE